MLVFEQKKKVYTGIAALLPGATVWASLLISLQGLGFCVDKHSF
jgi:hypothetical protein